MYCELSADVAGALIHVLLSVDESHLLGLVGVVSSVLRHAAEPGRLRFHVVVAQREKKAVEGILHCFGLAPGHQVGDGLELGVESHSETSGNESSDAVLIHQCTA